MAKVRITSLGNNAKQLNWPVNPGMLSEPEVAVNKTLGPVDRSEANLEAEVGETVVTDLNGGGIPQQYNIGGKRHSAGGTPLNLPEDSFIFSRDNKMKIKDEKIQKMFGMAPSKSGYTPAEIAKKYDLNRYHKILADPNTDDLQRDTAEMMIAQYNLKLAKLAMVQESMKGFPTGIPKIAEPYMESGAINPEELNITQAMPEQPGQSEEGQTERKYGGDMSSRRVRIVALPKAQNGKEVTQRMQDYDPAEVIKNPFAIKGPGYTLHDINADLSTRPLYTTGSPKRDLNKYLGTQKEGPKKMPGKAEAKKALTFDEELKLAEQEAALIKQEPSFWATLGDDIGHYLNIYGASTKNLSPDSPSYYQNRAEHLLKYARNLSRGINTPYETEDGFVFKVNRTDGTYADEIARVKMQKGQAEKDSANAADNEKKAVMDYLYATGQVKQPARKVVKAKPVAQPYTNAAEYMAHLSDPFSEEKRARQAAFMKANPEFFPDVDPKYLKKQYGGTLKQYAPGGPVIDTTKTKVDANGKPIGSPRYIYYTDGTYLNTFDSKRYNPDKTVYVPPAVVQNTTPPAASNNKPSTGGNANASATTQQSKGNFNYVDRDKFSKDAIQAGGYDVIYGPDNLGNLPPQYLDPKTNTYYHLDKNGKRVDVDMADFAKRHAWFADAVKASNAILASQGLPGVDVEKIFTDMQSPDKATRRRATNMFQTAHSRMSKKLGIPQYFTEGNNPNDPTSIDSMFGNYTENAPVFRRSATKTAERDPAVDRKRDDGAGVKENPLIPQYDMYPDAWFPQDLNNVGLSRKEKSRIPQEMEWGAIASARMAPYVLRSPERALAANSEAQNIAAQNINAYGFNPTANRASIAAASGKAAANAANIEAQVEADNIGTQNAAWARNADTANRFGMYAAGERNDQYHNQLGMNRDRISALNKSDREIVRNINQGITNTADAYNTNLLNDNYKIDPRTGGKIYFTPTGRKIQAITPQEEMAKKFLSYKERLPGVADDVVLKMMGLG